MLEQLRRFNADATDLEDAVALLAFGKLIRGTFEQKNVGVPEWLDDSIRRVDRAIDALTQDKRELRAKEIKAELARLQTPTERRAALQQELDALATR